jgi:predicted Rossmann fold nucleotide-binding protein DprA/Smf involved in DNA uptake
LTTDSAKAIIALASRLGDTKRPSLSPTEWSRFSTVLADQQIELSEVFSPSFDAQSIAGIDEKTAAKIEILLQSAPAATVEAAELGGHGIATITIVDGAYPDAFRTRLGSTAPPIIHVAGNVDLLVGDGIGIVGSRNVREEGAEVARQIATEAVRLDRSVVSGGARGVDQVAMNAAYQAGGSVVGVLADSLQARVRKSDVLRALDAGSTCLITQQAPSVGFTPASAMGRNKLVYALSALTIIVATDSDSGGTWAGATEAIKRSNGTVAVWRGDQEGPGNAALENRGAVPIRSISELAGLLDGENPDHGAPPEDPVQLGLLDTA